ncbi:MAG TPA: DUF4381 domain-containing protein [Flavobacteriaceae bacterium]|nr:DUF4381 domain-containing protein [Flavobacteriaceae bacterium]
MRHSFFLYSLFAILFSFSTNAQEITASIDTATIKIGEQIRYRISVETDSSNTVVFPPRDREQTFSPLELVEAYKIDTSKAGSQLHLLKEYALTKFDSGTYVIPPQRVKINNREILTDSFLVEVRGVAVDTTKQKMYPIKPSLDVPDPFRLPTWIWWVLGSLVLLAAIVWAILKFIKKKVAAKKNIPPFEKAMLALKELDEGNLLENREIKNYYSVLTDAARRYLDEQVDDRALESTTSELIDRLQLQKDAGKLNIEQTIIDDFDRILKRADLAKFARSKPDVITAKEDRGNIEKIIKDTKQGIPEPTEEELQKDEAYRKKLERKQQRKRKLIWIGSGLAVLAILAVVLISTKGVSYIEDAVFGNTTEELLEGDWITSDYGNPPVRITTPEVLVRVETSDSATTKSINFETFSSGKLSGDFYVKLSTAQLNKQSSMNPEKAAELVFDKLENEGAKNIITKKETLATASGVEGNKTSGSFSLTPKASNETLAKKYVLLTFVNNGGLQQILMVYNEKDEYAEKISSRILYSVELKTQSN